MKTRASSKHVNDNTNNDDNDNDNNNNNNNNNNFIPFNDFKIVDILKM